MAEYRTDDREVGQLLKTADEAHRQGRPADARRAFERVLERDPDNPVALNAMGMQALAKSDPAGAEAFFARAAAADPLAQPLWMNLATAQRAQGDDAGEEASLLKVLDLDQRHFMALVRLAELHERRGEQAQALQRWDSVAALGQVLPERSPALEQVLARAQAFVIEGRRQFGEAIDEGLADARAGVDAAERRRFDACVDAVSGRRRIYVNECAGIHYPFLPADEFFDRAHFPWLADIEARTDAIRAEVQALMAGGESGFSPYVAMGPGMPETKWTPLDNSLDWSAFHLWRHGRRIEEACARCPATAAALDAVPQAHMPRRAPTAFFSILRPRTRIPPHTGVSNVRTIIHLPLIVPDGCGFRVGGETRQWRVGEALAFDDTIEHEAWNDSDEPRAVLIFDVWNPHLSEVERGLLQSFFAAADACGHDPGMSIDINDG